MKKGLIGHRYVISGRVQGVGFRYYVQRAAVELGVTGWARNLWPTVASKCKGMAHRRLSARLRRAFEQGRWDRMFGGLKRPPPPLR